MSRYLENPPADENASPSQRTKKMLSAYPAEDYKTVADKLQRQLLYREKQLQALRAALNESTDNRRPVLADDQYRDFVSGVAELAGIPAEEASPTRTLRAVRQRMHNLQEDGEVAARRAKTVQDRLLEVEVWGVKSDRQNDDHSLWILERQNLALKVESAENAAARLEVELLKAKEENLSLLGQTAGLEQTRLVLKRQIESIKSEATARKASARDRSAQTEGGLRLSREELDLRLAKQNADETRRRCEALEKDLNAVILERNQLTASAELRASELQREIIYSKEEAERKVSVLKREMLRMHTTLVEDKTTAIAEAESKMIKLRSEVSADYETRLAAAIKLREEEVFKSMNEQGSNYKQELEALKLDAERQRGAVALKHLKDLQDMQADRLVFERTVREEMTQLQSQSKQERYQAHEIQAELAQRDASLQSRLDAASEALQYAEERLSAEQSESRKKEAEALAHSAEVEKQCAELSTQLKESQDAVEHAKLDLQYMQDHIADLEILQTLPDEVTSLKSELASVSHACQTALIDRDTLRQELVSQTASLSTARDTIETLHLHLDSTEARLHQLQTELGAKESELESALQAVDLYRELEPRLIEAEEVAERRAVRLVETQAKLEDALKLQRERDTFMANQSALTQDDAVPVAVRGTALAMVAREARLEVHRLLAKTELKGASEEPDGDSVVIQLKSEVQELTEAKARVEAQRRDLQMGARDLCDKVSVMSDKYRVVTAELELTQRQLLKLQNKYNRVKQEMLDKN